METENKVMEVGDLQNQASPSTIWSARFEFFFSQPKFFNKGYLNTHSTKDRVWVGTWEPRTAGRHDELAMQQLYRSMQVFHYTLV